MANKIQELQDSLESGQVFMFHRCPAAPTPKKSLHDLCDSLRIPNFVRWPLIIFNLIIFVAVVVALLCCAFDLVTPDNIGNWMRDNKKYVPSIILCVMIIINIFVWRLYTLANGEMPRFIPLLLSLICLCGLYWLWGSACAEFLQKHWKMILCIVIAISAVVGIVIDKKMM